MSGVEVSTQQGRRWLRFVLCRPTHPAQIFDRPRATSTGHGAWLSTQRDVLPSSRLLNAEAAGADDEDRRPVLLARLNQRLPRVAFARVLDPSTSEPTDSCAGATSLAASRRISAPSSAAEGASAVVLRHGAGRCPQPMATAPVRRGECRVPGSR